ncbi:MAG: hypothetical protein EB124_12470, partial [Betaproteobacteria bacterium]|nr:hypothetical protein [Betaproteobacteria bacterium]
MQRSVSLAETLKTVFGEVGEKIGTLTVSLTEYGQQQEKNAKTMASLKDQQIMAIALDDREKVAALDAEIIKQGKKSRDDELKGQSKILASTKVLFKEKSGMYKVLNTLEKITHIERMTNTAIELSTKLSAFAAELSAAGTKAVAEVGLENATLMAKIPAFTTGIFAKITEQIGIPGPIVAAGIVAAIFAAFGGGKGSKPAFVPTAEQQQKVQGTAMGYDSTGKEVQVRRGVFGDTEAKSESIAKSLDLIKENSVDGLSYDNKILNTLKSIDSGINQTAKRLYSVQGLRTGSMFDTATGTKTSGGFLGISQLFGSSTSTEIKDAGILLNASFGDLATGIKQGAVNFYEEVQRTVKKSGFLGIGGSTKTYIDQNRREVDSDINKFFTDIFGNAQTLITDLAVKTGTNTEQGVKDILSKFEIKDLKISLKGLSGEALAKEVESVISSILDDASLAVFESFEKYADFGEGLLETVIRVTDTNEKVAQQIKNLGLGVDLTNLFDITEGLAKAAGGLDEFISKTEFFRENFLTQAERIAPISKAVGEELARLSLKF